MRVIVE